MLPRLWQCADASWWELWTSMPVSSFGMAGLIVVSTVMLLAKHPYAEHAVVLINDLASCSLALGAAGLTGGVLLRLLGRDPTWRYSGAALLWLLGGWPLLFASLWRTWRAGPAPAHRLRRRLVLGAAGVATLFTLLFRLGLSGTGPMSSLVRTAMSYAFDGVTPFLATDECLAEHRLEYLSRRQDPQLDAARLPGYVADAELEARAKSVDPKVYARALRTYRAKVRRGDLLEPETLDAAACNACPGVEQELRSWIDDTSQTDASRELARQALSLTLYPPIVHKRRHGGDSSDHMLRYPSRSP